MSPTVHVPAMLSFTVGDAVRHAANHDRSASTRPPTPSVSDFGQYLQHPDNRKQLDFQLKEGGYDTVDHQAADCRRRPRRGPQMEVAGWPLRRQKARFAPAGRRARTGSLDDDPFRQATTAAADPDGSAESVRHRGRRGQGLRSRPRSSTPAACWASRLRQYRTQDGTDGFLALPGDDVEITYPSAGTPPKPLSAKFTVVDFYESKMNEYDSSFVFVPIRKLQELRGMIDPATGVGQLQLDPDPAQAGGRPERGPRPAAGPLLRRRST